MSTYLTSSLSCQKAFQEFKKFDRNQLWKDTTGSLNAVQDLHKVWVCPDDKCGNLVFLSVFGDDGEFNQVKSCVVDFLNWLQELIKDVTDDFKIYFPDFDFLQADSGNNIFVQWIKTSLTNDGLKAIMMALKIFKLLDFYANDTQDCPGNLVKPILDNFLNYKISKSLIMKTVLEAIGLNFEGRS